MNEVIFPEELPNLNESADDVLNMANPLDGYDIKNEVEEIQFDLHHSIDIKEETWDVELQPKIECEARIPQKAVRRKNKAPHRIRATVEQMSSLLDFIQENKNVRLGIGGTDLVRVDWNALARQVNAVGGAIKTSKSWKKAYFKWNSYVRLKLRRGQPLSKLNKRCAELAELNTVDLGKLRVKKLVSPNEGRIKNKIVKSFPKKATSKQMSSFLEFIQKNEYLRSGLGTADVQKAGWDTLSREVNAAGPATKTGEGWKKAYIKWKSQIRIKLRKGKPLSQQDKKCVRLAWHSITDRCKSMVKELGVLDKHENKNIFRARKATSDQMSSLLDFIEQNKNFRVGKRNTGGSQANWEALTQQLNAVGGTTKTVKGWKKTYTKWRAQVRSKLKQGKVLSKLDKRCAHVMELDTVDTNKSTGRVLDLKERQENKKKRMKKSRTKKASSDQFSSLDFNQKNENIRLGTKTSEDGRKKDIMESGKRRKIVVSIEERLNAFKRLDSGESPAKISSDLGVGRTTVIGWLKRRTEIENLSNSQIAVGEVKKKNKYDKVSEALFLWFTQQRNKGMPIIGSILKEKALQFQREFNEGEPGTSTFSASDGWLFHWKKRYRVKQLTICGEKLSVNVGKFSKFKENKRILINNEGLTRDQLYNCDETGLNYKMLPSKSLASRLESSAPECKKSKERVTILACSNASGNHKLKLTFIGKPKTLRAFKHLSPSALPVSYHNQKSAGMDTNIFKNWFFGEFVPSTESFLKSVNLPRKAVLVLDKAPSHLHGDELKSGDIKTIFLPPNVTSLCQPMNQGVLKTLKKKYRHSLITALVEAIDNGEDIISKQKKINLKDVVYWIAQAWEDIEAQTLAKSWNKLLSVSEYNQAIVEDNDNVDLINLLRNIPGCENMTSDDIEEWMKHDEQQELTDNDIVTLVNGDDTEDEQDVSLSETNKINHCDAIKALDTTLEYIEQQVEMTSADIIFLQRLRNYAIKKKQESGELESNT